MSTSWQPTEDTSASRATSSEESRSLGDIMGDLTANVSTLMRQEVALAKAEVTQSGKQAGKGAGLLAGAGVAGNLAITFLSLALWWAIAVWIGDHDHPALAWSGLIITVLWGIVAAVLAARGRAELKRTSGLEKTTETVSKIPDALKGNEENNR